MAKRYRFNGKERDEETGLYYYGARYYAAWVARWTSTDPLGIGADGPGVYNYTRGSPVTLTDPNGTTSFGKVKDEVAKGSVSGIAGTSLQKAAPANWVEVDPAAGRPNQSKNTFPNAVEVNPQAGFVAVRPVDPRAGPAGPAQPSYGSDVTADSEVEAQPAATDPFEQAADVTGVDSVEDLRALAAYLGYEAENPLKIWSPLGLDERPKTTLIGGEYDKLVQRGFDLAHGEVTISGLLGNVAGLLLPAPGVTLGPLLSSADDVASGIQTGSKTGGGSQGEVGGVGVGVGVGVVAARSNFITGPLSPLPRIS